MKGVKVVLSAVELLKITTDIQVAIHEWRNEPVGDDKAAEVILSKTTELMKEVKFFVKFHKAT